MSEYWIAFGVPLLVVPLSIPLILGKVPPNRIYGFRPSMALLSSEKWYPANRAAGWFMLVAMGMAICFNMVAWWIQPEWLPRVAAWGTMMPLLAGAVGSFIYYARL